MLSDYTLIYYFLFFTIINSSNPPSYIFSNSPPADFSVGLMMYQISGLLSCSLSSTPSPQSHIMFSSVLVLFALSFVPIPVVPAIKTGYITRSPCSDFFLHCTPMLRLHMSFRIIMLIPDPIGISQAFHPRFENRQDLNSPSVRVVNISSCIKGI